MATIDRLHMEDPSAGTCRLVDYLKRQTGKPVDSPAHAESRRGGNLPSEAYDNSWRPTGIFPYLLKDMDFEKPYQVWSADITYTPMRRGFMYFSAIVYVQAAGISMDGKGRWLNNIVVERGEQ